MRATKSHTRSGAAAGGGVTGSLPRQEVRYPGACESESIQLHSRGVKGANQLTDEQDEPRVITGAL